MWISAKIIIVYISIINYTIFTYNFTLFYSVLNCNANREKFN